jgi:hypothetical protein
MTNASSEGTELSGVLRLTWITGTISGKCGSVWPGGAAET